MRLKVLHVVPGLDPAAGGPSRSVLGLARAQAANGASVSLVTGGTATPSAGEMSARTRPMQATNFCLWFRRCGTMRNDSSLSLPIGAKTSARLSAISWHQ